MAEPIKDIPLGSGSCGQTTPDAILERGARRRPRKVVVYYFDSDADVDAAVNFAAEDDVGTTARVVKACSCKAGAATAQTAVAAKAPRIGSPTPIGFYAFGMTTMLYNVHNAKICPLNMATMGLVVWFGGITQLVCGFLELVNMNTLGCTISSTYGAFWLATAVLFLQPTNSYVEMGEHTYTGGFFLMWFFFASSLLAASARAPLTCIALMTLVPINFLLQSISYFTDSAGVMRVAGYEGIVLGALATYIGMAFTLRDAYGRSILPIFFHQNFRQIEW